MMNLGLLPFALLLLASACGGGSARTYTSQAPATPPDARPQPIDTPVLSVPGAFLVAPYLQLGPAPSPSQLALLWQTPEEESRWAVNLLRDGRWRRAGAVSHVKVHVGPEPRHRVYTATLAELEPGKRFAYQVTKDGQVVFQDNGMALKAKGQPQRVAVAGDLVTSSPSSQDAFRALARQMGAAHPDLLVVPGDIVNMEGHAMQYRQLFFPNINAEPGASAGGSVLRNTVMAACLGNNDTDRVLEVRQNRLTFTPRPEGLAYYYYFSQPLNGPVFGINHDPARAYQMMTPVLNPPSLFEGFLAAARNRFPAMANYSFDSGGVHWTFLDSNLYSQWAYSHPTQPGHPWQKRTPEAEALVDKVKTWLARDLADASGADWRFVVFHHPAFNLAHEAGWKYRETWMRQIWPILEKHRVSLVFSGHLHSYQRSRPLRFAPRPAGATDQAHFENLANLVEDAAFTGQDGAVLDHFTLTK
jgi:acid phosphatase type 7